MIRRYLTILFVLLLSIANGYAQKFLYDVDFLFDFDNREYHDPYDDSQTIAGFRLTPTVGVGFADSLGGEHKFMAGVSYIQPFGAGWKSVKVMPTVYYQWKVKPFKVSAGFIPYSELYSALPDYLMSDSLAFMSPNIQGLLAQFKNHWGYLQVFADWRGMMQVDTREAFRIVADGKLRYKWAYWGLYAQLNHLANSAGKHQGVCDDAMVNPLMGFDFTSMTPLDSLSVQVGYLFGVQRDRNAHESYVAHGGHIDLMMRWRFIGFKNSLYFGEKQMPFYERYGSLLNQGDPHYNAMLYDRMDIYLYLVRRSFVTCYASWNLLITDRGNLSHQQQIVCRFSLDQVMNNRKRAVMRTMTYR